MRTRLLHVSDEPRADDTEDCEAIEVRHVVYRHTAAKFWPRLIDESREAFPDCTRIELTALTP
ncbi:MAG: hypothetical protein O3A51_02435, partial [Verrucomicrobia bacterium]|nr:hypothetical protein [Verrucomicrobiota bacterium]